MTQDEDYIGFRDRLFAYMDREGITAAPPSRYREVAHTVAEHMLTLDGYELDAFLVKIGFKPDELLARFNKTFEVRPQQIYTPFDRSRHD